jgi:hypothetical protein
VHFRTRALVARVLDSGNGLGVHYPDGMPRDAFEHLIQYSVAAGLMPREAGEEAGAELDAIAATPRAPAGGERVAGEDDGDPLRDRRISDADAERVRRRLRTVVARAMQRVASRFFEVAGQQLLVKARDAGTNAVEAMYLEGLDIIEKQQAAIATAFTDGVLRQVDEVSELEDVLERKRRRESGNTTGKLELVDTEQFEEWLSVAEIISKAENRYAEELLDLRAQLGLVAKPWSHKDVIPVGPAVVAWSFHDATTSLDFRRQVRNDLYRMFEGALVPVLGHLYAALAKALVESRIFPSVEELRETLRERSVRRNRQGVRLEPEVYRDMDNSVREAAMAADGVGRARVGDNPYTESPPNQAYATPKISGGTAPPMNRPQSQVLRQVALWILLR